MGLCLDRRPRRLEGKICSRRRGVCENRNRPKNKKLSTPAASICTTTHQRPMPHGVSPDFICPPPRSSGGGTSSRAGNTRRQRAKPVSDLLARGAGRYHPTLNGDCI